MEKVAAVAILALASSTAKAEPTPEQARVLKERLVSRRECSQSPERPLETDCYFTALPGLSFVIRGVGSRTPTMRLYLVSQPYIVSNILGMPASCLVVLEDVGDRSRYNAVYISPRTGTVYTDSDRCFDDQ